MVFFYAFIGVLCLGLAPLFGKTALNTVNPILAFAIRTLIAAGLMSVWLVSTKTYSELPDLPLSFWVIITVEATLAAVFGDLAYFYALQKGSVSEVSLIMSCAPLVTIAISHLLLNETISFLQLLGASFITIGLFIITTT